MNDLITALQKYLGELERVEKINEKLVETRGELKILIDRHTGYEQNLIHASDAKMYKTLKQKIRGITDQIEYHEQIVKNMEKNLSLFDETIRDRYRIALMDYLSDRLRDTTARYDKIAEKLGPLLSEIREIVDILSRHGRGEICQNLIYILQHTAIPRLSELVGAELWDGLSFRTRANSPDNHFWHHKMIFGPKMDIFSENFINNLLKTIDKKRTKK